mmetsp:Transcript_106/g.166  ORF Transcript_106/g.166 Transcript_106/m.166 type:complete len:254 (-) Transcript_106:1641-2402(-)
MPILANKIEEVLNHSDLASLLHSSVILQSINHVIIQSNRSSNITWHDVGSLGNINLCKDRLDLLSIHTFSLDVKASLFLLISHLKEFLIHIQSTVSTLKGCRFPTAIHSLPCPRSNLERMVRRTIIMNQGGFSTLGILDSIINLIINHNRFRIPPTPTLHTLTNRQESMWFLKPSMRLFIHHHRRSRRIIFQNIKEFLTRSIDSQIRLGIMNRKWIPDMKCKHPIFPQGSKECIQKCCIGIHFIRPIFGIKPI